MKKTKLVIYRSAEQCAQDSLTQPTTFAVATFGLNRFNSEGLDPRDYDFWVQIYNQQRQNFIQLNAQQSNSTAPAPTPTAQ